MIDPSDVVIVASHKESEYSPDWSFGNGCAGAYGSCPDTGNGTGCPGTNYHNRSKWYYMDWWDWKEAI